MAIPILATKHYPPPLPLKFVTRPRLVNQLNEGLSAGRKLTLISAPAGFGKSTLVSEWITGREQPAAWLSLDENDNDPTRFLIYLISALQTNSPDLGADILAILQSQQIPPLESILTALLNELVALPNASILVLDDYHLVETKSIDEALTFLVDHLPAQMHVVITTREDPSLPIPRLRARNQLTELRAADLRFTPAEATEFLKKVMDLDLSVEDVAALESRTEGWIAGLQLAALSMKGQQDVHGFIQAFAGDHRYILEYLVEEVLQRQPEDIRNFLLQTSILDQLNGPLCDAVTAQAGSRSRLESLQRGNLFLIPLDDQRHWYRYHHLFADVLRMHLLAEQPDQVSVLHRRASEWYEQIGSVADAIHHALAAKDFDRAANLIERSVPEMRRSRQEITLLSWFKALPEGLFRDRPMLSIHYAGTLLQSGYLDGVESRLRDAERWLNMPEDSQERPVYVDEDDYRRLPGLVAMYHAGIALVRGDASGTIKYARQVLELAPANDSFLSGAASGLLGLAYWTNGDLETARQTYADGMAHLLRVGFISDTIGGSIALADIRITQGRLPDAMGVYQRGLQLAREKGLPGLRGTADMYVGMSELDREHNDLKAAMEHLQRSQELGELAGFPQNPYRWRVAMARNLVDQGDLHGALDMLQDAERLYVSDFFPNVRPIAALRARLWIIQGSLEDALDWAREKGLSAGDSLSYLREYEYITLARILLAQHKRERADAPLNDAIGLLQRLLEAAEEGGRLGSAIEILVLQALVHQMRGDIPAALAPLKRALQLAEPEGYARIFIDEGPPMAALLKKASKEQTGSAYIDGLLSSLGQADDRKPAKQSLIEPLSERELEVLRLFRTELSGPEIARELTVSLNTLRTHTKNIYSKLGVNSRRAAVRRAEELNLL